MTTLDEGGGIGVADYVPYLFGATEVTGKLLTYHWIIRCGLGNSNAYSRER